MESNKKRIEVIAKNIKSLLKDRGITQKKLAKDLNLSQSAVTAWMKHRNAPTFGVIQDLANYFDVKKIDIDSTWTTDETDSDLTPKDEQDIQKMLDGILKSLDRDSYESDEAYETMKLSLECTLRISKMLTKDHAKKDSQS